MPNDTNQTDRRVSEALKKARWGKCQLCQHVIVQNGSDDMTRTCIHCSAIANPDPSISKILPLAIALEDQVAATDAELATLQKKYAVGLREDWDALNLVQRLHKLDVSLDSQIQGRWDEIQRLYSQVAALKEENERLRGKLQTRQ